MKTLSCSRKIPPSYAMRSHVRDSDPSEKQLRVLQVTSEAPKFPTESIGHPGSGATGGGRVDECGEEGRRMSCPVFFIDINHQLHNYQTSTQNFQLKFIIKWRGRQELRRDGAWLIILTGDRWGEQSLIVRIVIRSPRLSLILLSPHQSRPHPETLWRSYNSQLAHTDTLSAHIRFSIINISLTVNSTYRQN